MARQEGLTEDLDWDWIDGMGEPRACELRIHDTIGGNDNLRVIFWAANETLPDDPLPRLWTIAVLQKKTGKFSNAHLRIFKGRLKILQARLYRT